jgi:hypothetical protein
MTRSRRVLQAILKVLLVVVAEKVEPADGSEKTRSRRVLQAILKVLLVVVAEKVEPAEGAEETRKGVKGLPKDLLPAQQA